jgi:hypothetical protein
MREGSKTERRQKHRYKSIQNVLQRSKRKSARVGDASKAKCSFGSAVCRRRLATCRCRRQVYRGFPYPVPSQPEGSLVHPRELLDPTAQGHGFVQCSVSLPGRPCYNTMHSNDNLWGRAVQSRVIGIGNSLK